MVKYYSDKTGKYYESEEKALAAENKLAELKSEREKRAKEVEQAFIDAKEARGKANKLLNAFVKDYGSFHTTIKEPIKGENIFEELKQFFDYASPLF